MKPRTTIIVMAISGFAIFAGLDWLIYLITYTPTLWGVRGPLIYLMLISGGVGVSASVWGAGFAGAIIATKDRVKRKLAKKKLAIVERKVAGMR